MSRFSLTGFRQKLICLIIIILLGTINYFNYQLFSKADIIQHTFLVLTILISIIYFYIIFFSMIIINKKDKIIVIKILSKSIITLQNVNQIQLEKRSIQNKTLFVLVLYNDKNETLNTINTFLSSKQKKQAEMILSACQELIN